MRYKTWLAGAGLSLGLTGLGCQAEPPASEPVVRPVRYQRVFAGSTDRTRSFSGVAQASLESNLSFKVAGTIERLAVNMGDVVAPGQLIAQLDNKDYELRVQQTAASYEQAKAQQRNAQANYQRVLALYENNNTSRNELDASRASKESADAQVRSLDNSLQLARLQLSYTRLTAPVAGSISRVPVEPNENVQAGQAICTLTAGSDPEVVVGVPEMLISQISSGDRVEAIFDAIPGRKFAATVTEVAVSKSSASSTFAVTARVEGADDVVRSGMACEVSFTFDGTGVENYLVPPVAVQEDRSGRFVYVVELTEGELGQCRRRPVETGQLTSDGIEVVSGLRDGDLVVTAGVSKIQDGLTVRLMAQ